MALPVRAACIVASLALLSLLPASAAPDLELNVTDGTMVENGDLVPVTPLKDLFGPGQDAVVLSGSRGIRTQLHYPCAPVPEGNYYLGLVLLGEGYVTFAENYPSSVGLYLNDTRLVFTTHTEPMLPETAGEKRRYQAEMRCDAPVHIGPGDVLRVVYDHDWGHIVAGPTRLYEDPPPGGIVEINPPDYGKIRSHWLVARWGETRRDGGLITQSCELFNPGVAPRELQLSAIAKDYFGRTLLSQQQTLTLQPCERREVNFDVALSDWPRASLSVTASSPSVYPPVRLTKYWVDDTTEGPRPSTDLNGEWETCAVPGAQIGDAPPADAEWAKVTVPSVQPIKETHCAWYRKTFTPPAYITGERVILKCDMILSEATFYLNGTPVGYEKLASQPFEVDVTAGFKPGEPNELLVGVRDWIAYSPRNQERITRGEAPIFKDSMLDVCGYPGAADMGIGGCVSLEARPAVSVDDVFVVTSVRNKTLSLRYRLRNTGAQEQSVILSPRILDQGQVSMELDRREVAVPAGGTVSVTVDRAWPDAKLWWPESPHLYILETALKPGAGAADRHIQRFGFREMWVEGISYYLNGTRMKIRSAWANGASGMSQATGLSDPGARLAAISDWQTYCMTHGDTQLTRTHNMVGVREACEIADETGMLVKIEEADFAQVHFTFDRTFWENALQHELRVIDTYKNHASVVIWSAGNENMWGWIYQGEAAKTLGNRWQIKIAQAMREFDLMRRPIEWESDGDLMGGWEYHALHYPFELSSRPDVPDSAWWGPLDGKTVVPYSMGPITLGEKALTVGEAFWPATLSHPYGQTIVLGDAPYLGGNYWNKGWIDSSRYFINGFRDVEFALIDVYTPLSMVKPQTIVLKQETRSYVGGQTVRRDLNIHNDVRRPASLTLRWRLESDPEAPPLDQGRQTLDLAPAELARVTLNINLPAVRQTTPARFMADLYEGDRLVHSELRDWDIAPPVTVRFPENLQLSVYDPQGDTEAMLARLGVPFGSMEVLLAPPAGALIIGRKALQQPPPGPWREALSAFVRDGGKVLILEQTEAPDFLPVSLTLAANRRTSIAFCRAADHPALAGLSSTDLRFWGADHLVSLGNYRKPIRGNALPLVDVGTTDGIVETPLIEEYDGKGSFLLCQMLLTEKAAEAPAAGRLVENLLNYLAAPECFRSPGATALFAAGDSLLRKALDDVRLVYEDLAGQPEELTVDRFGVAVVDLRGGLDAATSAAVRTFAESGGRVLLHRATPETQEAVEGLAGLGLRILPMKDQPNDIQYHVFRRADTGLMAGISNHEFFWATNRLFADLRHEGGWWSGYPTPPEEWIADYVCLPGDDVADRAIRWTRPGGLLEVPLGEGSIIINQLRIDEPLPGIEVTATRLRSLLLTNLGCTLRGDGTVVADRRKRLRNYEFFTVDLGPYANRGLMDDEASGLVGWTNQGENDMRALPTGNQTFAGIPFHIASPKSAVVLYSVSANNVDLPKGVTGIKIGRQADVLFFLHTMAWGAEVPFKYRINYEDGTSLELPVVNGRQVVDWWSDPTRYAEAMARHGLFTAWQGDNPMHKGVLLPGWEWTNPSPEKPIATVDFLTEADSGYTPVPVLAAITGAVDRPREGVVVDVIGTEGIRVKIGTQESNVYYTGVAGIPEDHPFREKAVAAHRALVVGQKVSLQLDTVTIDPDGRSLAWVYLGSDQSVINKMVNARLIGDGLSTLGPFHGNTRHRTYMENLGFIAEQRKAGLWAE